MGFRLKNMNLVVEVLVQYQLVKMMLVEFLTVNINWPLKREQCKNF